MANFWANITVDGKDVNAAETDRDSWPKTLAFFKEHLELVHTA